MVPTTPVKPKKRKRRRPNGATFHRPLSQRIELLKDLVHRDIKLKYKRSVLGIAWTMINPMLFVGVLYFIFIVVRDNDRNIDNFVSFLFSGIIGWQWFQTSLSRATGAIVSNAALIRQPGFPRAILPVSVVVSEGIHFLLALPVLIFCVVFLNGVSLKLTVCIVPIIAAIQFVITMSLAYFLAAINVTFRDTQHTIGVLLRLLFYLSGIFYDITTLPEPYRSIAHFNPMVPIINSYRMAFLPRYQSSISILALTISFLVSLAILPLCLQFFRAQSRRFVEEL